ncbi:MAG: hypothetical protein QXE50_05855 [Nitrososphaerota archaeon]
MRKDEIAGRLRTLLGVDVKFEKLTLEELEALMDRVSKLLEARSGETQSRQEIFPLGIIPAVFERVRTMMPQVREEILRQLDTLVSEARGGGGVGEKKEKK